MKISDSYGTEKIGTFLSLYYNSCIKLISSLKYSSSSIAECVMNQQSDFNNFNNFFFYWQLKYQFYANDQYTKFNGSASCKLWFVKFR